MQGFYERPGGVNHEGLLEALRRKLEDESVSLIILEGHRLFEEKTIVDEFDSMVWIEASENLARHHRMHKRQKRLPKEQNRVHFNVHVWPNHLI